MSSSVWLVGDCKKLWFFWAEREALSCSQHPDHSPQPHDGLISGNEKKHLLQVRSYKQNRWTRGLSFSGYPSMFSLDVKVVGSSHSNKCILFKSESWTYGLCPSSEKRSFKISLTFAVAQIRKTLGTGTYSTLWLVVRAICLSLLIVCQRPLTNTITQEL